MNSSREIRRAIATGLIVAVFLLNTSRALKAIELCKECLFTLNNKTAIKQREVIETYYKIIYSITSSAYYLINDYTNTTKYDRKLLEIYSKSGEKALESKLSLRLAELYHYRSKHFEAAQFCTKALEIFTETCDREGEASCYATLGTVFLSLGENPKAKGYFEEALEIKKDIDDRAGEASCYEKLGDAFYSLGEYRKAKDYTERALAIKEELGDKRGEATSYGKLGNIYLSLGEYFKSEEYLEKALTIRKEIDDRNGEAADYSQLGIAFRCLGEHVKAKDYHEKSLAISQEIGDRNGEAISYGNIGTVFLHLGEYAKAQGYIEKALAIKKEIGDCDGEATGSVNLGNVFLDLGKYAKANDYFQKALAITKETGCRKGEATSYGSLGNLFFAIGDYVKAKEYQEKALVILKEIGNRDGEAAAYGNLGNVFLSLGEYIKATDYLEKALAVSQDIGDVQKQFVSYCRLARIKLLETNIQEAFRYLLSSIQICEQLRRFLGDNDQFKICFTEEHIFPYWMLTLMFCAAGIPHEALYVSELGRARALADLMSAQYSVENQISHDPQSWVGLESIVKKERNCTCLYISYSYRRILFWVIEKSGVTHFRQIEINENTVYRGLVTNLDTFFGESFRPLAILPKKSCEDRSLNHDTKATLNESEEGALVPFRIVEEDEKQKPEPSLSLCYKMIVTPVADLLDESEIIIVPDRSLYKVPFAALPDQRGKYLCETFRIRIVPSLTTLKLIQDSPADYHSQTGALIVGDPDVGRVRYKGKKKNISRLPCAGNEAAMIGRLLGVQPLLGEQATKQAVLERINSVSLIHIAAHGDAERGEIALSPHRPINRFPEEEDYLLTMSEISQVQLRAKLVVLSCCHSGRGHIQFEGVVGIARAFLGSGARSVLVAQWALDDTATEQLMNRFYNQLVRGHSASESLHEAMSWMRANGYSDMSQWAPFVLIGDDVTFEFGSEIK